MANSSPNASKRLYSSLILMAYLAIGFVPNAGAVDQIAPQWLYLNAMNIVSLLFVYFQRDYFKESIQSLVKTRFAILYAAFIIWASASYFYAINPTEVLVNLARVVGTCIGFFNVFVHLSTIPKKFTFIAYVMTIYLTVEMYMILKPALEMLSNGTFQSRSLEFKGTTGNINIAALSLVMKIPFALYLMNVQKNNIVKLIVGFVLMFAVMDLVFLSSRASFLALGFSVSLYIVLNYLNYRMEGKKKSLLFPMVYYIIPLLLGIGATQLALNKSRDITFFERAESMVSDADASIASRTRFYVKGFDHLIHHPLISVGLGNWKLKSIEYDKEDIKGYVVPYHMHNDIIQIGAELGWPGFFMYMGIFIFVLLYIYWVWKSKLANSIKFFSGFLVMSLMVYVIDASFNFPIARPIMQIMWVLVLAFAVYLYIESKREEFEAKPSKVSPKALILVLFVITLPLFYVAYLTNLSLRGQQVLLGEYNRGTFNHPLSQVDHVVPNIPNISVTTLPIVSMKGRYYAQHGQDEKALEMYREGIPINPYLGFSETLMGQVFLKQQKLDSAHKYFQIAYNKLPIPPHFANYLVQALRVKDKPEIQRMFLKDSADHDATVWKNYLVAMNELTPPGDPDLIHIAKRGIKLYPEVRDFRVLAKIMSYGKEKVDQAYRKSEEANKAFAAQNYLEAARLFEEASQIDPLEFSYYENVGAAYYSSGDYEKALPFFDKVIKELNPASGKSEYLKGISLVNLNRREEACELFIQARKYKYDGAKEAIKSFCQIP